MIVVLAILRALLGLALGADRVACPAGWWAESLLQPSTTVALVECVRTVGDDDSPPLERAVLPIVCRADHLRRDAFDPRVVRCAP